MNFFKRSWFYLIRKRGKSFLLFAVLLLTSTLILCGLSIKNANASSSDQLKEQLGGGGVLIKKISGGSTELSKEFANKVLDIDGVTSYNAENIGPANLKDLDGNYYELKRIEGSMFANDEVLSHQANIYGYTESKSAEMFTGGSISLKEGRHITKDDENVVMISSDFAKKNNLKLGDIIDIALNQALTGGNKNAGKISKQPSIIGIFNVDAKQTISAFSTPGELLENTAIMDVNSTLDLTSWASAGYYKIYFRVKDSEKLNSIILEVQKMDGFNGSSFEIKINDKAYQSVAKPLKNINELATIMLITTIVISVITLTLLLIMWAKGRLQESGILLSMGLGKGTILLQRLTEVIMIALLAFGCSYFTSSVIAQGIGNSLLESSISDKNTTPDYENADGSDFSYTLNDLPINTEQLVKIDIQVSTEYLLYVYLLGGAIVFVAVVLSSYSAIKQTPKELLLKRE